MDFIDDDDDDDNDNIFGNPAKVQQPSTILNREEYRYQQYFNAICYLLSFTAASTS